MIKQIEELPDEIFLDLFENYIRLIDIYVAFLPLKHQRINRILKSCSFYIDIPSKDIFHSLTFDYFALQIVSLRLTCFCPQLDLSKLIHLRSLHLERPTRQQLISINAQSLPNLHYLSLLSCWFSFQELPKHLTTLFDSSTFPNLNYFIRPDGKILHLSSSNISNTACPQVPH